MPANVNTIQAPRLPSALVWGILFLVFTAIGILFTGYRYLDDLSREITGTLPARILEEGTGTYSAFVLLPGIFFVAQKYLFKNKGWLFVVFWHLLAAIAFSCAHTTLMAVSRQILFPLAGLGHYNYGLMIYRYPMEFSNDLVLFTIGVIIYYYFQRVRVAQAHQLAAADFRTKLAQAQLENLRLQIQPHFLFNTLNTISSVMYDDVPAADEMIGKLSDLLRLTLQASRSHEIPLSEELKITKLYLELMQKRYENKLRVTYSIAPETDSSLVPQLILQPLLENSLRHGMKSGAATMDLSVVARRENGSLILQVSDNGVGFGPLAITNAFERGVGLSNIRDRLLQLYGNEQQFSVANHSTGGAEITLHVPYRVAHTVTPDVEPTCAIPEV